MPRKKCGIDYVKWLTLLMEIGITKCLKLAILKCQNSVISSLLVPIINQLFYQNCINASRGGQLKYIKSFFRIHAIGGNGNGPMAG